MHQVFRFSPQDLGETLLKNWNFPDTLCERLADLKRPGREALGTEGKQRRLFKGTQEYSQALLDPDCSWTHRQKLQTKMARDFGIDPEIMAQSLATCTHRLQTLVRVLRIDGEGLGLEVTPEKSEPAEAERDKVEAAQDTPPQPAPDTAAGDGVADQEASRLGFLLQVIEESNQAMATGGAIHQIILMILESIFQGIGFDRVVFCMVDPQRA